MRLFRRNLTKWIPLGNYGHTSDDYIVLVRGNRKTGMLYFKVKKVHNFTVCTNRFVPNDLIDVKQQWNKIMYLTHVQGKGLAEQIDNFPIISPMSKENVELCKSLQNDLTSK